MMRTKDEILKQVRDLCINLDNDAETIWYDAEAAWYAEQAKLEALLDIRNILDELTIAVQNIATLGLEK